jgi:UDP-glucose 4-epimerase
VPELIKSGREVTVLDILPRPIPEWGRQVRYFRRTSGGLAAIRRQISGAEEVVDLAYATVPKTSFDAPIKDISANLPFAVDLFEAARMVSVKKLVIISSGGTIYGPAGTKPIKETHPTNPISPYGLTKLAVEKYAFMFSHLYGLPVVVLRPGNAYGEGQRAFTGQGFIPAAISSVIQGKPVTVFGRSGTVRDYIHVQDIARSILAALKCGQPGECYNVGTGVGYSNIDVLKHIAAHAEASGLRVRMEFKPECAFDVPVNILDSGKLSKVSGWQPKVGFEDGLARTWRWFLSKDGIS